ncbi:iron-containing alcohol dehydrogenase [Cupriavidus consociatus]|uniref:iron-containing alcohol dehydrogenase n=1 Tax=Cupriavidus consociatus TaxID=2821357 RepID=UPI001AE74137|nr:MULTISPECIES: iron-containing alcohol dehydrogenase [unclassified Cupriavidus]MBP0623751.1 iron-containing alcohol dehydrogenase [Cupriavidus sp. LEh25]MDK2660458.1 iron-containing alcohol dehydrogenase [Cupriavidus sp. LEh21]
MKNFEFHNTRSMVVERGGAAKLHERVAAMGYRSALIVTDAGLLATGILESTLAGFAQHGLRATVFSDVQADPPEAVIQSAVAAARACLADCVVGVGGGSSMDAAKLAALLACSDERLDEIYGVNQVKGPRLPLILVPTTAGTGSEVTPISIVTTGVGEKKGVVSPVLLPDVALLDAELTLGLPSHITAATGIDAMVHAVEAFTSKRLKNPISDCLAREALHLLSGSLHRACAEGSDLAARENMLIGACLAGMAFANAPVAAVHALAYPIGARFHVPHGLSNALVLGPVMRFNLLDAASMYAELAAIVVPDVTGDDQEKALAFAKYLEALSGDLGLPTRLRDVGIAASDLPALAEDAMKQTRLLVNNPRELGLNDALAIYEEAL